jgi:quercetin dioxygenase-like cupin family protein
MMADYQYLEDLGGLLPEIPDESIVSRSVLKNEHADVTLFGFAVGQELTEHTSSRPAVLHFIKGTARVTLGGDEKTAEAGTWVYMPPHLPHSITAETPVVMLLTLLR